VNRRASAALVVLTLVACQRGRDETVERVVEHAIAARGRESKVTIDRERGSITVDLGGAVKPPGWPSAVPLYPHAARAKVEAAQGDAQRLAIVTEDSVADVRGFYRGELARLGWELEESGDRAFRARRGMERLDLEISRPSRKDDTRAVIEYRGGDRG